MRCGLRREARLSSEANKPRFEKALTELQTGLKVLPVGIAPAGAWRYAFHLRDSAALVRGGARSGAEDRSGGGAGRNSRSISAQCDRIAVSRTQARLFGWKSTETQQAAERLAAEGRVELDVKVTGVRELQAITLD